MRWIVVAATLALLGACENRIAAAGPTGISVEGSDFARDGEAIAKAHCARYGKTARLKAVEPMTHFSWIQHYDCI